MAQNPEPDDKKIGRFVKNPTAYIALTTLSILIIVVPVLFWIIKSNFQSSLDAANKRADEAEKNVVIERAKRDADAENATKRVEYWINMCIQLAKESGKAETLGKINQ